VRERGRESERGGERAGEREIEYVCACVEGEERAGGQGTNL